MDTLRQRFGNRIRVLRKRAGLSQEQTAEKADISVDFLSLIERGINAPSFETLERLAGALELPVRDLFDFESDNIMEEGIEMKDSQIDLSADSEYLRFLQLQALLEGKVCVVGALILNSRNRLFVQKRSTHRRLFPGAWDIAGGRVDSGETLYQALAREINEETGWELSRILAVVHMFDWEEETKGQVVRNREFDFLAEVTGDLEDPRIERSKFSEFRWVARDELDVLKEGRTNDLTMFNLAQEALELGTSIRNKKEDGST